MVLYVLDAPPSRGMTPGNAARPLSVAVVPLGSSKRPQKHKLRIVVTSPLQLLVSRRRLERSVRRLLHHHQRAVNEPTAGARRRQRLLRQSLAIRRIEERQRERLYRIDRSEPGRIAPINLGAAACPQRLDIA